MRTIRRAAAAALLVVTGYPIAVAVASLLLASAVVAVRYGPAAPVAAGLLCAAVVVALGFAVLAVLAVRAVRRPEPSLDGLAVSPADEPQLWSLVRELARHVGTRAPDRIVLVADANAAVVEQNTLFGVGRGHRTMDIGLPLLMTLTVAQASAVLCHELGHYSGRHTRLGPLTFRGHAAIQRMGGRAGHHAALRPLLEGYARVFHHVSHAISHRQELEADAASVRTVGKVATASAMCEADVAAAAWAFFVDDYVDFAVQGGVLPDDVFGGFRALLDDPQRRRQMLAYRAESPDQEATPFDTHPSLAARLTAIEQLPEVAVTPDNSPALSLLRDPARTSAALQEAWYDGTDLPVVTWEDAVAAGARHAQQECSGYLLGAAEELTDGLVDLSVLLTLLEHGRAQELGE